MVIATDFNLQNGKAKGKKPVFSGDKANVIHEITLLFTLCQQRSMTHKSDPIYKEALSCILLRRFNRQLIDIGRAISDAYREIVGDERADEFQKEISKIFRDFNSLRYRFLLSEEMWSYVLTMCEMRKVRDTVNQYMGDDGWERMKPYLEKFMKGLVSEEEWRQFIEEDYSDSWKNARALAEADKLTHKDAINTYLPEIYAENEAWYEYRAKKKQQDSPAENN